MIDAPTHLTRDFNPVLDDPRHWHEHMPPVAFNRAGFQSRINAITGLSGEHPILRLIWADEHVDNEFGETHGRYTALYSDDGREVSAPRYIIEERFEPGQYFQAWQQGRYIYDPRDDRWLDKGDPPREGWYGAPWMCADHDPTCCQKAKEQERTCWGYFRLPNERDLFRATWAFKQSERDKFIHPHEPMTLEELESLKAVADYKTDENRQESLDDLSLRLTDFWRTHSHRLRCGDNAKHLKHGKYLSFGNWKKTESGIVLPN